MPVDLVAIFGIIFGTTLIAFITGKFFGVWKYWIDRKHEGGTSLSSRERQQLEELEAFRQRAEKRLQVLESIIVEKDDVNEKPLLEDQKEQTRHSLEDQPRLKNMLRS